MLTKSLNEIGKNDILLAGGKGASLGEMIAWGIPVPPGFVVLAGSEEIGNAKSEILISFKQLSAERVAVRSSATAEDGTEHAWAGQLETYLNVTEDDLIEKIQKCRDSINAPRAVSYRKEKGLKDTDVSVAVVVQKMVDSKFSGIAFSVHPVTENRNQIIIEASSGLGEAIVSGEVTPDSYIVSKEPREIISVNINSKSQILSEEQILELSELIMKIENHFNFPCDIEWAHDGNQFYIIQSRPITTLTGKLVKDEWIRDRFFNAFLVEESLVLLLRDKFFLKELGYTYKNGITVKGIGDYMLKSEEDMMKLKKQKVLKPEFNFIYKINELEEKIKMLVSKESLSIEEYTGIFEIMSEHLAYYGLAKEEAELIFNSSSAAEDKDYIEKWRNDKSRWNAHDKLWERISKETNVPVDDIHNMLLNEVVTLLRGEKINLDDVKARKYTVWSLVQEDGEVTLHLKDMSPEIRKPNAEDSVVGQTAYSNGKIVRGVVGKDVLVVKKTHPGMIDEIRRAAAVVTDEGGILSHAAITAREFGIPTIIGTKTATERFKNGDNVEIDTENGTIKVLI